MRIAVPLALAATMLVVTAPACWAQTKIEKLIKGLEAPDNNRRLEVMEQLGAMGAAAKEAVPPVAKQLRYSYAKVADQSARPLAQIGAPAVDELAKALKDPAPEVCKRSLEALRLIGPDAGSAAEAVARFLTDKDVKFRILAAQTLAEMGPQAKKAASALGEALRDGDPLVRLWSAQALREIGPESVSYIVEALKDKNDAIRHTAAQALTVFTDTPEGGKALAETLRDPSPRVRFAAFDILIRLGPDARFALPGLLENLQEKSIELQSRAFAAIMGMASLDDDALRKDLVEVDAKGSWSWPSKKPRGNVKFLTTQLDGKPMVRLGATLALGQMGPEAKPAIPRLAKLVKDSNASVRAAAIVTLAAIDLARAKDLDKAADIIVESVKDMQSVRPLAEELVQMHMLLSVVSRISSEEKLLTTVREARIWLDKAIDEMPESADGMMELIGGMNVTAQFNLGFLEPFGHTFLKIKALAKKSKDAPALLKCFNVVGNSVPKDSPFNATIQGVRFEVLRNRAFLDGMILMNLDRQKTLKDQINRDKLLELMSNPIYVWKPNPPG